ncbi:hypothetical protein niasHT_004277 [Heterodera trifolii]|uniref:Uncharacterized protein n=1 Tax=Heterodera trifolii TaxID=157864 RepID=A0ABD2LNG8_9BILA
MPISQIFRQFCRRKRLNLAGAVGQPHSEWDRRLGRCSLAIIVTTLMLAVTFHVILPAIFSDYSGRKIEMPLAMPLLSLAFASALTMLSTVHLCSISRRIAKNGALYQLAYCTCGQAMAIAVALAQLLDQMAMLGTVCHVLSDHINLLFHNAFVPLRFSPPTFWPSVALPSSSAAAADGVVLLDLLAAVVLPFCAALVMTCSVRVLITSSLIFLIASLFTSASTTTVAFLHNLGKLRMVGQWKGEQSKMEEHQTTMSISNTFASVDELFLAFRWWFLAWPCIELLSFLAEECIGPRRALPFVMRSASRIQPALALLALLAFFPFIEQCDDVPTHGKSNASAAADGPAKHAVQPLLLSLPAMFNSIRLFSARYLMNVGSVCSLWAALLCLFLAPTRLLATLAMDQMGPPFGQKHFAKLAKKGGQPRFGVLFVAFCCSLITLIVPRKWLCRLLPVNCVLRMAFQALLVYMSHFTPSSSDRFLGDCGAASQKYRRVRRRAATAHRLRSPATEWKLGEAEEQEEEEEDYGDEEEEVDKSDDSEDEAWFRECRERERLLERIWRLESAESVAENPPPKSIDMPLLELNNPLKQTYQSIQNVPLPHRSSCHLPSQQNGGSQQQQQQQQRHNCFRAACSMATTMTVNGRTVHTVPFPGPHIYEADAPPGWLEAGGETAATRRIESGTKAAATRDELSACGSAQRMLLLSCSAAAVCAAAHAALRNASADYLPLLPLLALISSIGIVCFVIVWLCRLRVDYGSTATDCRQYYYSQQQIGQRPLESKWLPIGAVIAMFTFVQLFPLFPPIEWAFTFAWIFIGFFLHAWFLARLDNNN